MKALRTLAMGIIALAAGGNTGLRAQSAIKEIQAAQAVGRVQSLASQIEALNHELTALAEIPEDRASMLLAERYAALRSLAQLDSSRALSLMFDRDEADRLRSAGAVESEGEWEGNAAVVVADSFSKRTTQYRVWLDLNGNRMPVYLTGAQPSFRSGDRVHVRGKRLGEAIIAEDRTVSLVAAASCCPTVGEQEVATFLVNMPGDPLPPQVTSSFASQLLFSSTPPSLNSYLREASYGKASAAGQIFGPYTLPQDYGCPDDFTGGFTALIAAADSDVDFRNYNRIVVMRDLPSGCDADMATVGSATFISPSHGPFQASVAYIHYDESEFTDPPAPGVSSMLGTGQSSYELTHEFGHELGLMHANSLQFGDQSLGLSADAGTDVEYGDWFATMGQFIGYYQLPSGPFAMITPHYDAPHKNQLGWFAANDLQNVVSPGTFVLQPLEAPTGTNPKALRVLRSVGGADQYLWVEYRQPIGYDANWPSFSSPYDWSQPYGGALIHFEDPNTSPTFLAHSHLLDFTAATTPGIFTDAALTPGNTWDDPYSALSLTVNSATESALTITVSYAATTPPSVPAITSLNPGSAAAGSAAFTLSINGTGFASGDTVTWNMLTNQTALVTSYLNPTALTAQVPASLLATVGTAQIMVSSPTGVPSSASTFAITPTAPAITSVSPSSAPAGSPSVTITITGTGFVSGSVAQWNGLSLVTNYMNSTTLTAQIPAGDPVNQGTGQITVANPTGPASNSVPFIVLSGMPLQFLTVAPCRVMDTRNPNGPLGGPFVAAGATRSIPIASSACGIPANAAAYSLNLTVVPRTGALAYLGVWPTGQPQPLVSTLNSLDGSVIANAAIVPAGTAGAINAYADNDTDLIVDINGYFVSPTASALQFYPLPPCRVLDTRNPTGTFGGPSIAGGSSRSFPIPSSSCGVPANAAAYALNVTAVPQGPLAYLTAWPTGQTQPFVSTLNSFEGTILANAAIVPAGTAGAASFYATNTTDLVVDINGYFALPGSGGLNFYTANPCRLVDTRNPTGTFGGPTMSAGTTRAFPLSQGSCGLPAVPGAQAYSLNMTVVPQGALSYLSTWPVGQAQPLVSTLNAFQGQTVANAAIVPAGGAGSINVYVTNTTDVVIDTNGYFGP